MEIEKIDTKKDPMKVLSELKPGTILQCISNPSRIALAVDNSGYIAKYVFTTGCVSFLFIGKENEFELVASDRAWLETGDFRILGKAKKIIYED